MDSSRRPDLITAIVFLLSGSAALIFETVWFRLVGLALGSSVWSAAAVLMAFMSGLGIGNLLVTAFGHRIERPFAWYAVAEVAIGIFGLASVVVLPPATPLVARWLSGLIADPTLLNAARFCIAFLVFLIPAIAMGATLPILQKGLFRINRSFSKSLAHLYGWNTLGAVAGALLAEFLLIRFIGITGAAEVACALNFIAALVLLRHFRGSDAVVEESARQPLFDTIWRLRFSLLPPLLTGLILLALEVIWFRYLLLTQDSGSAVFAIMLAVVLAGIGIGGLVASRLKLAGVDLDTLLFRLCLGSAAATAFGFYLYSLLYANYFRRLYMNSDLLIVEGCLLMLPTCVLSGMLFPLFGERLHRKIGGTTSPSGALTFANTLGSAVGTGLATFALLPILGVENSILALALVYLFVALLLLLDSEALLAAKKNLLAPTAALALIVAVFPYGTLEKSYQIYSANVYPDEKLVAVREGVNETLQYYRKDIFDKPLRFRMVTNGHSMSGTSFQAQRYMRLFAYFPYLLHKKIDSVLQISYGVGVTAEAVVSLPDMTRYDVVDISRDVLEMSALIHDVTGTHPQRDPRTRVHVEDGRFFLQTTDERYDLITAEPPPPKNAGVVNLYSQEYFELIHERLNEGGIATYWLPAHTLQDGDTLAIIRAFCNAFADCSMWNSVGIQFMLVGSKGGIDPSAAATMNDRWSGDMDRELWKIGLEKPGQLGAMFMGDNRFLRALTDDVEPVVDDYPMRISTSYEGVGFPTDLYRFLIDPERRQQAFLESDYIREIFPGSLIDESAYYFPIDATFVNLSLPRTWETRTALVSNLAYLLSETDLEVLPMVLLGSTPVEQALLNEISDLDSIEEYEAAVTRAFVARDYAQVESMLAFFLSNVRGDEGKLRRYASLYYLSRALAGTLSEEELLAEQSNPNFRVSDTYVAWLKQNYL